MGLGQLSSLQISQVQRELAGLCGETSKSTCEQPRKQVRDCFGLQTDFSGRIKSVAFSKPDLLLENSYIEARLSREPSDSRAFNFIAYRVTRESLTLIAAVHVNVAHAGDVNCCEFVGVRSHVRVQIYVIFKYIH